jgi:hypothetical protein
MILKSLLLAENSSSNFLPTSELVPDNLTTKDFFNPTYYAAKMIPSANLSHFKIPPKILTKRV